MSKYNMSLDFDYEPGTAHNVCEAVHNKYTDRAGMSNVIPMPERLRVVDELYKLAAYGHPSALFKDVLKMAGTDQYIVRIDPAYLDVDERSQRTKAKDLCKFIGIYDPNDAGVLSVNYRDGRLYVKDGMHRLVAAIYDSQTNEVTIRLTLNQTVEEEAAEFVRVNNAKSKTSILDTYEKGLTSYDTRSVALHNAMRQYNICVRNDGSGVYYMSGINAAWEILNKSIADIKLANKTNNIKNTNPMADPAALLWMFDIMEKSHWLEVTDDRSKHALSCLTSRPIATFGHVHNLCKIDKSGKMPTTAEAAKRILAVTRDTPSNLRPMTYYEMETYADTHFVNGDIRKRMKSFLIEIATGELTLAIIRNEMP